MSYIDSKLINLNSDDGKQLNGTMLSNMLFSFSNALKEEKDNIVVCGGVSNASFCFSFYNINQTNNSFAYAILISDVGQLYLPFFTIPVGMYNVNTLISTLTSSLNSSLVSSGIVNSVGGQITSSFTFNSLTGLITVNFSSPNGSTVFFTFYYDNDYPETSNTIHKIWGIIGYTDGIGVISTITWSNSTVAYYPVNLLGNKKINVYSNALANTSMDSKTKSNNNLVRSINVDVPPFSLISFINTTGIYGVFKNKRFNNIDIQLLDENGNFIDFLNIGWTMSIQIITTKKLQVQDNTFDRNYLANIENPRTKQKDISKNEKLDTVEILDKIRTDLDLLTYN